MPKILRFLKFFWCVRLNCKVGSLKLRQFLEGRVDARDGWEKRHVDFEAGGVVDLRNKADVGNRDVVSDTVLSCAVCLQEIFYCYKTCVDN